MGKYDPLRDHLKANRLLEIVMTFRQIEALVGTLPASARRNQFWANTTSRAPRPQRDAVRDAGYDSFLISGSDKVRFVRRR